MDNVVLLFFSAMADALPECLITLILLVQSSMYSLHQHGTFLQKYFFIITLSELYAEIIQKNLVGFLTPIVPQLLHVVTLLSDTVMLSECFHAP